MKKGEVWLVDIPIANGHEQGGSRPVIVIADARASVAIVIPCTSNLQALRFPFTLQVSPSRVNGFHTASIVLVLQLRAIDKRRLHKKVGILEKKTLKEIDGMVKNLLDI